MLYFKESSVKNLRIAVAQVPSIKGDVNTNVETHLKAIVKAGDSGVSFLMFPELSLTGYEPELAKGLAFTIDDARLEPLIQAAVKYGLYIVAGAPLVADELPQIGALIVSPEGEVSAYSKMNLHPSEDKYFLKGETYQFVEISEQKIAIAVCADTNTSTHAQVCSEQGSQVYVAGVLITEGGYKADTEKLESYARNHGMLVAMANHNAPTGGWSPIGKSAIWSHDGKLVTANEIQSALVIAELAGDRWIGELIEI